MPANRPSPPNDRRLPWPRGPWPNGQQALLLKAGLLEDDAQAIAAWNAWRNCIALDDIDPGCHRLLPLVYHRLPEAVLASADGDRIKGVARYYWVRYQRQMQALRSVLTVLARDGIETLLLKGTALNLTVSPPGTRPMEDLDVVVPRRSARRAMQILRQIGWKSTYLNPEQFIDAVHGCQFETSPKQFLDLHWDFFRGRILSAEDQTPLWDASEVIDCQGVVTRVLSPAHQLLHTCVHGARWCNLPPLRWLADACLIIRKFAGRIDGDDLVDSARRYELSLYVSATLSYLAEELGAPIPPATLTALRRVRTPPSARLEYFVAGRQMPGAHLFWKSLPLYLVGYWRHRRQGQRFRVLDYLQLQHHFERPLSQYLPNLCALQLAGTKGSLQTWGRQIGRRLCGMAKEQVIDIGRERWALRQFHELESTRGQLFRWSRPEASVLLAGLQPADYRVVIHLAHFRAWTSDLARHLTLAFNGRDIPREALDFSRDRLSFRIDPSMFAERELQKLAFCCAPLASQNGDTRPLGVPLCSIRFVPCRTEPHRSAA
jgi:hypothetical protein